MSRTEEPAKACICARDRRALQQLALNVHVKHTDLAWELAHHPVSYLPNTYTHIPNTYTHILNRVYLLCVSIYNDRMLWIYTCIDNFILLFSITIFSFFLINVRLYWRWKYYCPQTSTLQPVGRKEGNVLFNDALNTFYLRLYGVRHMVKGHSIAREETHFRHIGYSFRLAARVLLYASSHRQSWSTGWNEKYKRSVSRGLGLNLLP